MGLLISRPCCRNDGSRLKYVHFRVLAPYLSDLISKGPTKTCSPAMLPQWMAVNTHSEAINTPPQPPFLVWTKDAKVDKTRDEREYFVCTRLDHLIAWAALTNLTRNITRTKIWIFSNTGLSSSDNKPTHTAPVVRCRRGGIRTRPSANIQS